MDRIINEKKEEEKIFIYIVAGIFTTLLSGDMTNGWIFKGLKGQLSTGLPWQGLEDERQSLNQ